MEPTAELKQAVKKYKEGKSEAFTMLYEESSKYIYTCIYKVMGGNDNVQDAVCDIMQDTYVEISRNITQLDNENSFLSWAGTIATRKCYAWLKKNRKYVLLNEEDDTFENLADDDNIIPEEVMQDREKQRLVREIIDTQLTEMQRICIIAFYYNEQKQSEIARELGIPENTVKTNLSRAKAKIKGGVLDLEKKQGTRLYSIAPFLLLLFKEDVSACTVPASVTTAINSSVLAVGKRGIKHLFTKIAEASTKAKMAAGVIGVGTVIATGSVAYVAMQNQSDTWEKEFKDYLLRSNKALGFDLNDFEEDGIPELIVLNQDGSISVRYSDEYEEATAFEFDAVEEVDGGGDFFIRNQYRYGYDVADNRLLRLNNLMIDLGEGQEDYNYEYMCMQFQNGTWETWEAVTCGFGTDTYPVRWSYDRIEGDKRTDIPQLYASTYMSEAYRRFNEIEYTDITEKDIEERFQEFKENGNREKVWDGSSIMEELNDLEARYSQTEEISAEMSDAGAEKITLSEKEQKDIETLVSMLSLNSYFFGGNMYDGHYPVDDVSVNMKLIDMLGNMGLTDRSYMEYLPPTETDDTTLIRYCKSDDVQDYLKNVFGIENADLSIYCDGDRVVFDMVGDYVWVEISIDDSVMMTDGIYKINGEFVLWNIEETPEAVYPYELTVMKNDVSPFGFQLISMEYQEKVTEDHEPTEQMMVGDGSLSDILLNPEKNKAYYPQGVEYQHILFALLDIDQDGEDEVLLGSASDISPYWGANWITIFNILRYDRNTGKVSDFDGDKIYSPLDANSWHYYDTGILMTMVEAGQGHTNFWNLLTGEFVDAALQVSEDPNGDPDSEGHSKIYNMDGRDITGEEADQYYQFLKSGNEIPIIWCEVSQDNVDALVTGGNVRPVYIPTPYGRYRANRGFELEFFDDNTVLVSEGNSNKKCAFTIDGAGNLIIDPDGEVVEGTYDAQADEIKIYELRFRR